MSSNRQRRINNQTEFKDLLKEPKMFHPKEIFISFEADLTQLPPHYVPVAEGRNGTFVKVED